MTTSAPALSVIVPTWNRSSDLRHCLQALVAQEGAGSFEIVVVDDGSTDETASVVAQVAEAGHRPAVRLLRSSHRGINAARNLGVRASVGDLICFTDDDAVVSTGWATEIVEGASRYAETGVFAGRLRLRFESRPPRTCGREPLGETELDLGDDDREADIARGACLIVRRDVLDRVGPFDESLRIYGDETEWLHRYKASGGRIVYLAGVDVWHRRTAKSLRIGSLIGRSFTFGRGWAGSAPTTGKHCSVVGALGSAVRGLAHGVRFRCFVGLRNAVSGIGTAVEATRMLVHGGSGPSISWLPGGGR